MKAATDRALAAIRIVERTLIVAIFLIMVFLYSFNVFVREAFPSSASSFAWIDEATRLLMVWNVFLALGLALERGRHVAVTTLFDSLSSVPQNIIRLLINLLGTAFCGYMVYLGYQITQFVMRTGQVSPTLNLPMYWLYIAPTTGFFLLGLRYLLELIGYQNRHYCPDAVASCEPKTAGEGA